MPVDIRTEIAARSWVTTREDDRRMGNGYSFEEVINECPVTFQRRRYREPSDTIGRGQNDGQGYSDTRLDWNAANSESQRVTLNRDRRVAYREEAIRELERLQAWAIEYNNATPPWQLAMSMSFPAYLAARNTTQLEPNEIDTGAGADDVDDLDHLTTEERAALTTAELIEPPTDYVQALGFDGTPSPRIRLEEGASFADYTLTRTPNGIICEFSVNPRVVAWLRRLAIKCQKEGHAQRTVRNLKTSEQNIEILDGGSNRVWEINRSDIVTRDHVPNLRLDSQSGIHQLGWIRLTAGGLTRKILFKELDDPAYWFSPVTYGQDDQGGPRLQAQLNQAFTRLASAFVEIPNVVSSNITISTQRRVS
jgi:hypothetical protein